MNILGVIYSLLAALAFVVAFAHGWEANRVS